jgi:hypothetical protein
MHCTYCGSNLHSYACCPKTYSGSMRRLLLRCVYCGGTDHNINACPKTWSGSASRSFHPDTVADHFVKDK